MEREYQQAPGSGPGSRVNLEDVRAYYARQLQRWGELGGRSLKVDVLQLPSAANNGAALTRVEALARANRAVGYGSADAGLLGSSDPGRLLECAELLAKVDALAVALKTMQPAAGNATSDGAAADNRPGSRMRSPFAIAPEVAARQQLDLARPVQGEGVRVYQYFHQLIQQMKQQSRELREADLGLLDQVADLKHNLSFYTYPQALLMVSHSIEDEFVQKHLAQPFYTGVQYFSRLRPQEPRYRAILRSAQQVVVFGLPDVSLWYEPRLERVSIDLLRGTGLERFWFVVTQGPTWSSALLAEHLDGRFTDPLVKRRYQGFWTFDPLVVERIVGTLDYARALMTGVRQS